MKKFKTTIQLADTDLERALQSVQIKQGEIAFVVRPRGSIRVYTHYQEAMSVAVVEADTDGDVIVETYKYNGKDVWVFDRSVTVIVKRGI